MSTAKVDYLGELRTRATHLQSGESILTDAPVDNHGKGAYFSPTDLLATSLLTCMITTMGIAAQGRGWDLGQVSGDVLKVMANNPRRVEKTVVQIRFEKCPLDAGQRETMERVAHHCPVAKSLHPDLVVETTFTYVD
ncbi:MAG TPA: OsmC family protein [Bacteroidia bacterium]|nr:OsmC family protein [Bacteroidia bacterium]